LFFIQQQIEKHGISYQALLNNTLDDTP
jgi:predicted DNA binding CopG/RHH family protein